VLTSDRTKKSSSFLSSCDNPNRGHFDIAGMGVGTGFVGAGEDAGNQVAVYTDGNATSGYHINKGDAFVAWVMLVNYNKEPKSVYVTYDLEWAPGRIGNDVKDALISINECPGKSIKLSNSGPLDSRTGKWTFLEDGKVLFGRGHLHGTSVAIFARH
jgi:hypothetical protein